jgi:hypothetical protein
LLNSGLKISLKIILKACRTHCGRNFLISKKTQMQFFTATVIT